MSRAELGTMNLDCNCQVLFLLVSDAYMLNYHQCFCDKPRITLFFKKKKYLWLCWVFVTAHRFSLVVRKAESRLGSCGSGATFLLDMWNLPRPGIEPTPSALAGGFLSTAPPGTSPKITLNTDCN